MAPAGKMFIVSVKEGSSVDDAKKLAQEQGGTIGDTFNYGGFVVTFPEGTAHSLDSNEHIEAVEAADKQFTTQ